MRNGELGFWLNQDDVVPPVTAALDGDEVCDVAVIGGGLTGLWTAWSIKNLAPSLDVHVYEVQ